ncbi:MULTISPECIES: translation initiation factor IF-2 [unclassified Fusibacter]|uniref:translation initiation factor IF-2 n=1 Tax=unclassified Fusibacter TaxID=2624464 RepID=UPI001010D95E|nr:MULTISPECIES: translation initiation factor IF-2 [unclassified Fusibacter]MCK8058803.1 translation initiation factor IF-2 [Fusibacter sp. A2]NPE21877.1 translation initiation factor IF-2 [Fusibacter sp. A1]RXV61449.1 translation initiation factor IF-2 [Fusibacter sp. A1]
MSKIRIYQIAKELNIQNKELIEKLHELGIEANNHMSTVEDETVAMLQELYGKSDSTETSKPAEEAKKEVKEEVKAESDDSDSKKGRKTSKKRWHSEEEEEEVEEDTTIYLPARMTVGDFSTVIDVAANEVILKLMNLGVMAAMNHYVDYETLELLANEFGVEVAPKPVKVDKDVVGYDFEDEDKDLVKRAPVVTVMGHVDHGKTSLLDAIRSTAVTDTEAGGITQHIGASEVQINGEKIVFLDTPGHEAFTSLRARGAQVTDIAILVVAADDGVMPQTIEAIDHARAANVPIIVAVNKIDKDNANPDRVKQELSDLGVLVEDWGGDVISVPVSALKGENIDTLLEMVLLVAEMNELKANPDRNAVGTVIEAKLDKGRGAVATVLVQNGSLTVGDAFVCGTTYGRVRALFNHKGKKVKKVGPSSAVEVIGMNEVAMAGDKFFAVDSDKEAKKIAAKRALQIKEDAMARADQHVTLEDIFNQIQAGKVKELNLIIKADAHGSLEALRHTLLKLNNDEVKINIQHANIGAITESDIMLATASNTIVLGFNVRPSSTVIGIAKKEGVEIKTYQIIYELISDVEAAMKGMLDPEFEEVQLGEVQVRATFRLPNSGTIAGGYVISGKVARNCKVRLLRDGIIIHDGVLSSLKRFKDDVKEVATGYECGLGFAGYNDLKEGDIIEAYVIQEKPRK